MRTSLSCSVWRVRKLVALSLTLFLSGCTVMDVVGPRANSEILALARQAASDAAAGDELRGAQQQQLIYEALRLCGTTPSGETPSSCVVELGELPAATDAAGVVADTVQASSRVPAESVDLVVAQAIDAAAAEPVDLSAIEGSFGGSFSVGGEDANTARRILEREYAFQYALGVAKAFGDADLRSRIDALEDASTERAALLADILIDGETGAAVPPVPPVPAAGYIIPDAEQPRDAASAAIFVENQNADLVNEWRLTAADAPGDQWRETAIWLAAHAQQT